ncbi:hypothetical protein CMQ_1720 [Grosmannia clavigera kw1407]|uniref:Uncharacterized protein n=1 Tax=Grosmannia clavigera (strain kw1407 / UAMH 11150) TaxID=655863 RepID=F0XDV1_GROCL|nr:uncharacterized protein CMQ_1720 [Grosmannia clavigera kw1407]EFX04792.1 hypothetical protein CMQ_1720 [Grosmannia clavigera kw1407]
MDGEGTISFRGVKMEEAAPTATDLVAASPLPTTAASSTSHNNAEIDDAKSKTKPSQGVMPYRSWKRKHLKMRLAFEEKMEANARLHAEEVKAIQTSKRLAVEIDRVLDLLLDVNNSAQIPGSKRIDLSLTSSDESSKLTSLDIDHKGGWAKRFSDKSDPQAPPPELPAKSLQSLLHDVRHVNLAAANRGLPSLLKDLVAGDDNKLAFVVPTGKNSPQQHPQQKLKHYPESFLSADDIDNYLWEVDRNVAGHVLLAGQTPPPMLPTLAPFAHMVDTHTPTANGGSSGWEEFFNRSISKTDLPSIYGASMTATTRDSILRNPTSVFNWLKKNAPKAVFLQEGEATAAAAADRENSNNGHYNHGDDYHHYSYGGAGNQNGAGGGGGGSGAPTARGRKSVGGSGVERTASSRGGGRKRASAVIPLREHLAVDGVESDDLSHELATPRAMGPTGSGGRGGKRKRPMQDDDAGYRPRASTGAGAGVGATPTGAGGSSGRGTKRKRKSEGGLGDMTNTITSTLSSMAAKKARKSGDAAAAATVAAAREAAETVDVAETVAAADGDDLDMAEGEAEADGGGGGGGGDDDDDVDEDDDASTAE